eukprot:TRINITY_DN1904_c4_g1_i1.p1 TRINITY_DN1904_c4_g1~~TRINITY_DN1904_c4_g1_i1.p1  ORF type:complete len:351 (+),score=38.22 TRINITY_DN1904_c4_g1_i1:50-1054(+)
MNKPLATVLLLLPAMSGASKVFPVPQFYTTADCSGAIDAASRLWSVQAKLGGAATPFAVDGAYIQTWAINTCLAGGTGTGYSVMLSVDTTACATNGDRTKQLTVKYYQTSTICAGSATTTTHLTNGQCVTYGRGSIKFTPNLTPDELCTATNYVTAMRAGGIMVSSWANSNCAGTPAATNTDNGAVKDCAAEPACSGCCREYDDDNCVAKNYTREISACRKVGTSYEYALAFPGYSDSACTTLDSSAVWGLQKIEYDTCAPTTYNGVNISARISFQAPLTVDMHCQLLELLLSRNLDPGVVSWAEFNSVINAAGFSSPSCLVVGLVVLFIVLLA